MIEVKNNNIRITRGDTCELTLKIYNGESIYTPTASDHIIFTVKQNPNNTNVLIEKEFASNKISIHRTDTIDLTFGEYFYDVRLENGSNYDTIITSGLFKIERGTANG